MVAVTVTPFDENEKVLIEEVKKQTMEICNSEADAILPVASTGDYVKLDLPERVEVFKAVAEANKGRKKLIASACDTSAKRVLQTIGAVKELGYDACLVCPPYYYPLTQEAVYDFFKEVCEGAGEFPVIGYHVPFFTTGIEIPTFEKLLEIPNFVGMKDSSAVMKRIAHVCQIVKAKRPEFALYTGTDDCLFPALWAGCFGSMTALAATMPKQIRAIYNAFDAGNIAEAMKINQSVLPIIRACDSLTFPIGYKLLAKAQGLQTKEGAEGKENEGLCAIQKMLEEF
jgi:dihydrodipicolinate synthase/N-acetylneuraminate lyase